MTTIANICRRLYLEMDENYVLDLIRRWQRKMNINVMWT